MRPLDYLYGLELHGIKLGLSNITQLLGSAGDPHSKYPSVHIGGTNGKGSVTAFLDAMLRAAGYRTGRFTSPHLCNIRERFLVKGATISDEELDADIEYFSALCDRMPSPPTFFEVNTAIAFRHFVRHEVDVALVEVGLGGRFDSTNVIAPDAAAITNIALEHTQYLGDTKEQIAFEKAGIIKEDTPVVVAERDAGPRDVILARAEKMRAPVKLLGREFSYDLGGDTFAQRFSYRGPRLNLESVPLGLAGRYQGANAAVAVALAEILAETGFAQLDAASVTTGLQNVRWPCRLETVLDSPRVIIDVAHNEAGVEELVGSLAGPCVVVLAVASDKNAAAMIRRIAGIADPLILTEFEGRRALPVGTLCEKASSTPHLRAETLARAIESGIELATREKPLLIAGSLFTAGEARQILIERFGASPLQF